MTRFLHTADWQIGMTRRWLQGEAQARFAADRIEGIRRIGRLAQEQGCEFVVVAGDVFESNQLQRQTVLRALDALAGVPVPIYLLPGNHDPLDTMAVYRQPAFVKACPTHVHVLDQPGPLRVRDGLEIVAVPWHGKHPEHDLVTEALAGVGPADGTTRILVGHGAVDTYETSRHHRAAIAVGALEEAIAAERLHYVALGDRHSRTQVGSSGAIWYSGTSEVTDHREDAPGDVLVVDVEAGRAPVVEPHHVGVWDFRTLTRDLTSVQDVRRLDAELSAMPDKERTVVRLVLRGALGLEESRLLTEALAVHLDVFGGLRDHELQPGLVVLTGDEDWQALGLGGFVAAAVSEISEQAGPDGAPADPADPERPAGPVETVTTPPWSDRPVAGNGRDSDLPAEPEPWAFDAGRAPDSGSARDALALLYRLTKESVR